METRRNYIVILAAFFLVLVAGGAFFAMRRSPEDIAKEQLRAAAKKIEKKAKNKFIETMGNAAIEGGELSGTDNQGRPLWSVGAEKSDVHSGENDEMRATLTSAHATLYREGVAETTLTSAKLELTCDANAKVRLVLSGGVTAKTSSQGIAQIAKTTKRNLKSVPSGIMKMQSKEAEIDVSARRLVAKNGVTMTQGTGEKTVKVTAPQLVAEVGLANAQLSGGIVANAAQGVFKAPSATWNWKNHRFSATGGVTVTHDDTVLTGARLDADTQSKTGTISGDVKIKAPQGAASAPNVTYNWNAGRITARGGVVLTKDNSTLRAGSVECDDKLQNATANGGVTITKGDVTLRAASIKSFNNFARAEASGAVHLTNGNASLRAGNAQVFDKGTRAVAGGGVTVVQGELTVNANRAEASNLNQKGALRVVANGEVVLRQKDLKVTAGHAEVTNADSETKRRLVASGGVTGQNAEGSVRAARVTWSDGKVNATGGVSVKRGELNLTSDSFTGDDKGQNGVLTGKVVVKHSNGSSLQAPNARYDKVSQKVFANGGIIYRDAQGSVIHGQSLVANLKLEKAQITNVEGKINIRTPVGKSLF